VIRIRFIERGGAVREIAARGGATLMEVAVANGIEGIDADCGGACSCATCHVIVASAWTAIVGLPSAQENELLELAEARTDASRLSCQVKLNERMDGLSVTVP